MEVCGLGRMEEQAPVLNPFILPCSYPQLSIGKKFPIVNRN